MDRILLGACVSYGNHVFVPFEYDVDGVMFCFDSIYWTVGVKQIIASVYTGMARVITTKPFSAKLYFQMVEKHKVTVIFNTPYHMMNCLRSALIHETDLSSVKLIMFFGGILTESMISDIRHHFPNAEIEVNIMPNVEFY